MKKENIDELSEIISSFRTLFNTHNIGELFTYTQREQLKHHIYTISVHIESSVIPKGILYAQFLQIRELLVLIIRHIEKDDARHHIVSHQLLLLIEKAITISKQL